MSSRKPVPEMLRRQRAVAATKSKYAGRAFDWKSKATCVHMTRFHLRRMGRKPPPMPQIGSLLAARRAMAGRGWTTVADMLDGIGLMRIAPAFVRLGDLVATGSDDGLGSVYIATGESEFIGWTIDLPELAVIDLVNPERLLGAWRV